MNVSQAWIEIARTMLHSYLLCHVFDSHLNNWQDTLMFLMWLLSSLHTIYTPACKYKNRSILYSKIYHNIQVNSSATLFCCESLLILNFFFALVLNVKTATDLFSFLPQLKRIIEELAKEI